MIDESNGRWNRKAHTNKGSDLGNEYSASKLVARISPTGSGAKTSPAAESNLAEQLQESVDFSKGPASALLDIYQRGVRLEYDDIGRLLLGSGTSSGESYTTLSSKMKAYFELNHIHRPVVDQLNAFVDDLIKNGRALSTSLPGLTSLLQDLLQRQAQDIAFYVPHKRKRRRRH
ncbi:hypothetical protein [Taibaiella helva]|uniref:hypothetical protein n=1 Tax=Taibaiella helva TaxID=2301235 RepID=UPI000E582DDF|nr:hypothetical protein [Taibaiella helva]